MILPTPHPWPRVVSRHDGRRLSGGDPHTLGSAVPVLCVLGLWLRKRLEHGGVYSTVGFACVAMTTVRLAPVLVPTPYSAPFTS